jgi:hypothetical protein
MPEFYAIGASLAVVISHSAIWVDTKISALVCSHQLTCPLVCPLAYLMRTPVV